MYGHEGGRKELVGAGGRPAGRPAGRPRRPGAAQQLFSRVADRQGGEGGRGGGGGGVGYGHLILRFAV